MRKDNSNYLDFLKMFHRCIIFALRTSVWFSTGNKTGIFFNVQSLIASSFFFSNFISNNGGLGGAMSTAYVPLNFSGINVFRANKGRAFLVSDIDTNLCIWNLLYFFSWKALASRIEVHGTIQFIDNDGAGVGGGALYLVSMAHLKLFQGANLTFVGNRGVWVKNYTQ